MAKRNPSVQARITKNHIARERRMDDHIFFVFQTIETYTDFQHMYILSDNAGIKNDKLSTFLIAFK